MEHLAAALLEEPATALELQVGQVVGLRRLAACTFPLVQTVESPAPTPRVQVVGMVLPAGFGRRALASALLLNHPETCDEERFQVGKGDETWDAAGTAGIAPKHLHLEVLGGPEDGRTLEFDGPRDGVGRKPSSPSADAPPVRHLLYDGTVVADMSVSRSHLANAGPARVIPVKGNQVRLSRWSPAPGAEDVTDAVDVRVGDVLLLARATRLLVRDQPVVPGHHGKS